jgi:predicted AlkP superfamily phosphohydrolase/phosphomutase
MIAVDAGELSFIRAWRHKLPTFRRLFDEGMLLKLESSAEYITGSVWPTMYTGKSPGNPAYPVGSSRYAAASRYVRLDLQ